MDKFILNNDTWLRYLPIIMYGMVIAIAALLIAIAFLIACLASFLFLQKFQKTLDKLS